MDDDMFWFWLLVIVVVVTCVFGGWWLIGKLQQDRAAWQTFRAAHHCHVVGHVSGSTSLTSNGHVAFNDPQDTWLCDDGIMYTRERE